jgi:hypothetical protein
MRGMGEISGGGEGGKGRGGRSLLMSVHLEVSDIEDEE